MTLAVSTAAPAPPSPLRDTAVPAAPTCAKADVVSPEFMDEPLGGAFDSYGERNNQKDSNADHDTATSLWHLLSTIYIPILLFRLRRFFFGLTGLLRFLLLGQCLRFLSTYLTPSPTTLERLMSPWLCIQSLLMSMGRNATNNPKDPHAWPPPALTVLAILTIVAFVVHPDGMTWIMLGKLRSAFYKFLDSSTTCWSVVLADFGIFPTLAALTTFAALIFLIYVLHRTLSPRRNCQSITTKQTNTTERKRKKRKGNHPRGGGGSGGRGRIRGKAKHCTGSERRPMSVFRKEEVEEGEAPLVPASTTEDEQEEVTSSDTTSDPKTEFLPKGLVTNGAPVVEPNRQRVTSCSTVETVAMDDQSIGSVSIQSAASAPPASSAAPVSHSPRSLNRLEEGKKKSSKNSERKHANKRSKKSAGWKGSCTSVPTSPRTDPSRPSTKNVSSVTGVLMTGQSKSRRSGKPYVHGRTLADRLSSPVPPTSPTDSLFSTPLPSPTPLAMRRAKMTPSVIADLQPPVLTAPTPSSSLFSNEPVAVESSCAPPTSAPALNYSANVQREGTNVLHNIRNASAKKMELSSFLSQVGLVGTVCGDLVEALDDVDALFTLSDSQFELYNVSPDQKRRIAMMLEARCRARRAAQSVLPLTASPTSGTASIRPPPGLSRPAISDPEKQQLLVSAPCLHLGNDRSKSSLGYLNRTDVDFGSSPSLSSGTAPLQMPSLLSSYDVSYNSLYEQGDEEIEAELQELGGQMVGSILDFEG